MDMMSLKIRIGADVTEAQKGIEEIQGDMKDTASTAEGLSTKFSKIGTLLKTAFTAINVKKVAEEVVKLATDAASTTDHIDKMSQKIGISREAYQELDFVMSQSGTSVDSLQMGMKTLTAAMDNVKSGNKDVTDTFKKLGVEVTNSDGTFRSQEEVFFDTVTALQGVDDQTEKARLATELFGRTGSELMPLLNGAAGSMDEMRQQAHDLGLVLDDDAIDSGVRLTDTIDQVKRAFGAVVTQLGVDLMPVIQTVLDWVIKHMPEIRSVVSTALGVVKGVISALVGFIENVLSPALDAILTFTRDTVVPAIQKAWESFKSSVEIVFNAVKGFWTDTLYPALQTMWTWITMSLIPAIQKAWETFGPKIGAVFTAIKGFWSDTLYPALQTMWTWITVSLIPAVQKAWQDLQPKIEAVFNAIKGFWEDILKPAFEAIKTFLQETLKPMFENVFGAISKTVNICLSAIRSLWNDSIKPIYEGIVDFFTGVFKGDWETAWDGIKDIVTGVWNAIQTAAEVVWENAKTWAATIVANFKVAFTAAWDLVKDKITGVWDDITNKVAEIWEDAKAWGMTILVHFTNSLTNAWEALKSTALGIWDNITDKVKSIWDDALNWGNTIFTNFKESLQSGWNSIKEWFEQLWDEIKAIPQKLIDSALTWGEDLVKNLKQGIINKWDDLKSGVSDLAGSIADFLGFSVPKEGPLSDFDTYAPDMIDLFVQGINESMHKVTTMMVTLVSNIKAAFKLAGSGAYTEFDAALNGQRGNQLTDAIKNPFDSAISYINNINWSDMGRKIYQGVTYYTSDIYNAFKNAFDFSGIYVKTPHFWVSSWSEVSGTYYPNMSVSWYRKAYDNPIMFTQPTVLGTPNGLKGFGDGPGGEVVLSASKLRELVGSGGNVTNNNTINVYQREGEDMDRFVRRIEEIMTLHENQRKAAYA